MAEVEKTTFPKKLDWEVDHLDDIRDVENDRRAVDALVREVTSACSSQYSKINARAQRWWRDVFDRHGLDRDKDHIRVVERGGEFFLEEHPAQEHAGELDDQLTKALVEMVVSGRRS